MNPKGGFTLIEIVISLAILSIALVALLSTFNRTAFAAAESSVLTRAVMLGGEKMTQAMDANFPDEGQSEWTEDKRFPGYRFRKVVSATPFQGARLVQMEVQYNEKPSFSLQGYVIQK